MFASLNPEYIVQYIEFTTVLAVYLQCTWYLTMGLCIRVCGVTRPMLNLVVSIGGYN